MRTLALALLGLVACDAPSPTLTFDDVQCSTMLLEVHDALLPGWEVAALAAEQVHGDTAWVLGADPEGRVMLQPWPTGPGFELSGLGELDDFRLLPGAPARESWLVLDRPEDTRVWRLGEAARGEGVEVTGLGELQPGWTRRLVFIAGAPFLAAVPPTLPASGLRVQVAAIDPRSLTFGPWVVLDAGQPCLASDDTTYCPTEPREAWVEVLDVTGAEGAGGAATLLLGMRDLVPPGELPEYAPQFTLLALDVVGPDATLTLTRQPNSSAPDDEIEARLRGRLAEDETYVYILIQLVTHPDGAPERPNLFTYEHASGNFWNLHYTDPTNTTDLLQIGAYPMLGRAWGWGSWIWSLTPIMPRRAPPDYLDTLELASAARVTSAGREQILVVPESGSAMRVVAGCAPPL